jgi:hypothetical protein
MKATFLLCLLFAGYVLCETDATKDIKAVRGVFEVQAGRPAAQHPVEAADQSEQTVGVCTWRPGAQQP